MSIYSKTMALKNEVDSSASNEVLFLITIDKPLDFLAANYIFLTYTLINTVQQLLMNLESDCV